MKKTVKHLASAIVMAVFLVIAFGSGDDQTTEECKEDIRAYELGHELNFYSQMRGGMSLSSTMDEYFSGLGIAAPYKVDNPCVVRGWEDEANGIDSPYNKEGKSWNRF
jgi:hypothetical protein